jgi:hypothetical protein
MSVTTLGVDLNAKHYRHRMKVLLPWCRENWETVCSSTKRNEPTENQRNRRATMTKQNKADKVWAYLIKNPLATATEVAKATGVSYGYAHKLKSKVGTPKEVFEREAFENEVMRTADYDPVGLRLQEWRDMLEREDEDVEEFDLADMLLEKELPLRAQLLREAEDITCGDRHMDYGDPVENHRNIAKIASIATGHNLTAHDVVMVLLAAKMARARISPAKKDHYIDMMAYAGIAYECITDEVGEFGV